ncbi:hypothetical protein Ocin01_12443 [Orchesella cincta]|uniref:Transmembrane protein n=1 Tax=Orchesella cincta TaxID=48709 RepID=A0A1D2MN15_ORCCI|nr:hypothetical protein Ocin01_12443 [Orchesella cincta]
MLDALDLARVFLFKAKMVYNPCQLSIPLEVAVIVVAVIEAAEYFYSSTIIIWQIIFHFNLPSVPNGYKTSRTFDLILYSFSFLAAIGLFIGSQKKNVRLCWTWIKYTGVYGIITSFKSVLIIDGTCCEFGSYYWYEEHVRLDLLWLVVELYFVYVVFAFIKQLYQETPQQINASTPGALVTDQAQNPDSRLNKPATLIFRSSAKIVPNPCQCGISLEVGVIVVSVIEAVQYFYASIDIFFILHFYLGPEGWTYRPLPDGYLTRKIIDLIFYTIAILLAIGLFIGSQMVLYSRFSFISFTRIYFGSRHLSCPHITVGTADFLLQLTTFLVAIGLFIGYQKKIRVLCWVWIGHRAFYASFLYPLCLAVACRVSFYFACIIYAFIKQLRRVNPRKTDAELEDSTPAAAQLQPQPSAIAQEGVTPALQPDSNAEVSPV